MKIGDESFPAIIVGNYMAINFENLELSFCFKKGFTITYYLNWFFIQGYEISNLF